MATGSGGVSMSAFPFASSTDAFSPHSGAPRAGARMRAVEDGHGHLQRRFVFTVDDESVTASAMTTRLFTRLLTHARLQRAPYEPLRCVEKWHKALGAPLPPGFVCAHGQWLFHLAS